jgi:hypothetical protein
MSLEDINRMVNRSMGISNVLTGPNSITAMLEKSMGFSKAMTGMDFIVNANKHKSILGMGSMDWLGKNSALQPIGLPNNMFILKGLGTGIEHALSKNIAQDITTGIVMRGLGSVIANGSISKILDTQYSMLNQLINLKPLGFNSGYLSQSRNVFNTLGSLSARIATQGFAASLSEESYPYIEEATNEAAEITNAVVQQQYATTDDINRLFTLVNSLNDKLNAINKSEFKTFGFWLCVLSLFIGIYPIIQQSINDSDPNTASATKQQIVDLRKEIIKTYNDNINIYSPIRTTQRKCRLLLKPRLKSHKLMIVLPYKRLSVINTKGKWVLVTCLDKDSLPVTGWVLKKYLVRSKPIGKK